MNVNKTTQENIESSYSPMCWICGENHSQNKCRKICINNFIPDNKILSRAKLTLPQCLSLSKLADESYRVTAIKNIPSGTQFGPLQAPKIISLNPAILFPIKIFSTNDSELTEYYLDTWNENECNWMMFVCPANSLTEQNLICYQVDENIFYATIKQINPGDELRVWYAPYYALRMNKTILSNSTTSNIEEPTSKMNGINLNEIIKRHQKILPREVWSCKFCFSVEKDVPNFASHILKHYKPQRSKICEICNDKFMFKKDLKKHYKIVHNSERLIKATSDNMCKMNKITNFVANENGTVSKEIAVGGPLLLNPDSAENANSLLPSSALNDLGLDNENFLLESDNVLGEDILNEIDVNDSSQVKHICDICLKQFSTLKRLIIHIEQHTGKYFCQHCSKVFSRKENLNAHSCVHYPVVRCQFCPQTFPLKKYMTKHVLAVHKKKFACSTCNKAFYDNYYLKNHTCNTSTNKLEYECQICEKKFCDQIKLKKHRLTHKQKIKCVCPLCSTILSKNSFKKHLRTHEQPKLNCKFCDRKFHEQDALKEHIKGVHLLTTEKFECDICSKKVKTKKLLLIHKQIHSNRKYKCDKCSVEFKQKNNLIKHSKACYSASELNCSNEHFSCPICKKKIKLRRSLTRHLRNIHADKYNTYEVSAEDTELKKKRKDMIGDFDINIDTDQKCRDLKESLENMDFGTDIINMCTENNDINIDNILNDTDGIDQFIKERSEKINIISNEILQAAQKGTEVEREVCLSMPDLTETNHEFDTGKGPIITDSDTVMEPQQESSSNLVVYILNNSPEALKDLIDKV